MKILAISGSIRARSSNAAILQVVKELSPPRLEIHLFATLATLPHFNPDLDLEDDKVPESVRLFREELATSDALIISTPEYAHGIPGVLKNALDWLVSSPVIVNKPVGLIYGSAGDGSFARDSLKEILKTMSARVIEDAVVALPGIRSKIGPNGSMRTPDDKLLLESALKALIAAIGDLPGGRSVSSVDA